MVVYWFIDVFFLDKCSFYDKIEIDKICKEMNDILLCWK